MLGRAFLMETTVKSSSVESFQLFVGCEASRIRVVPQERSEKLLLPDLPRIRIVLRGPRMLRGAPEAFPGFAAFVDPHGGVGTAPGTLGALHKVMRDKAWEPYKPRASAPRRTCSNCSTLTPGLSSYS